MGRSLSGARVGGAGASDKFVDGTETEGKGGRAERVDVGRADSAGSRRVVGRIGGGRGRGCVGSRGGDHIVGGRRVGTHAVGRVGPFPLQRRRVDGSTDGSLVGRRVEDSRSSTPRRRSRWCRWRNQPSSPPTCFAGWRQLWVLESIHKRLGLHQSVQLQLCLFLGPDLCQQRRRRRSHRRLQCLRRPQSPRHSRWRGGCCFRRRGWRSYLCNRCRSRRRRRGRRRERRGRRRERRGRRRRRRRRRRSTNGNSSGKRIRPLHHLFTPHPTSSNIHLWDNALGRALGRVLGRALGISGLDPLLPLADDSRRPTRTLP